MIAVECMEGSAWADSWPIYGLLSPMITCVSINDISHPNYSKKKLIDSTIMREEINCVLSILSDTTAPIMLYINIDDDS